jgi:hypothetical protein
MSRALPLVLPTVAEIAALPIETPLATPGRDIVTTVWSEEVQFAVEVTSFIEPSLYVAFAENCWAAPGLRSKIDGLIAIEVRLAWGAPPEVAPPPPHPARTAIVATMNARLKNGRTFDVAASSLLIIAVVSIGFQAATNDASVEAGCGCFLEALGQESKRRALVSLSVVQVAHKIAPVTYSSVMRLPETVPEPQSDGLPFRNETIILKFPDSW